MRLWEAFEKAFLLHIVKHIFSFEPDFDFSESGSLPLHKRVKRYGVSFRKKGVFAGKLSL